MPGWTGMATGALGAMRAAEAVLRTIGGSSVLFRVPLPGAATGDGAQLGASPLQLQEVRVAPVLVRTPLSTTPLRSGFELVIAASTLNQVAEQQGASNVAELMALVAEIEWDGHTFRTQTVAAELFAGSEYLYRIQVME